MDRINPAIINVAVLFFWSARCFAGVSDWRVLVVSPFCIRLTTKTINSRTGSIRERRLIAALNLTAH